ncbi:MAG TPA: hypothetical protein VI318_24265 [Baekduia sp.]
MRVPDDERPPAPARGELQARERVDAGEVRPVGHAADDQLGPVVDDDHEDRHPLFAHAASFVAP